MQQLIDDLTAFVTALSVEQRRAIVTLAKQSATKAVKRRIQAEGRIKPWWIVPAAQITKLADYLRKPRLRPLCRT